MSELTAQLRHCAETQPDLSNPHWVDEARRLMRWAADSLDAADAALWEYHQATLGKDNEPVQKEPAEE